MRRGAALAIGAGAFGALVAAAQGCSLGLDPSLIGADAGADTTPPSGDDGPIGPPADTGTDGTPSNPDAATCSKDADCVSPNGCLKGHCAGGHCAFDVCPTTSSCAGSTCQTNQQCSVPVTFGFHAAAIHVGAGPVGCGGDPTRCLAVVYPFVFVGTANGVVAYSAYDASNPQPAPVPITGLPFVPIALVTSGSRVFFVGALAGAGPTYKIPIASIDVPSDPLAKSLEATSVFDTYTESQPSGAFAGPSGGLLLVDGDAVHFFPTALVAAPLVDGTTLTFSPSPGVSANAGPVTASGSRLIDARWADDSGSYDTFLSLETDVGTPNAQNAGETNMTSSMGPTTPQSTYAQGADGSVLWNAGAATFDDAGTPLVRAARFAWVLGDAKATTFDAKTSVDVEVYAPPVAYGTQVSGQSAWVDANQALVLAAAANQVAQTSVQLALKSGTSASLVPQRRFLVPVGVGSVGAASSGGFGYVLANDAPDSCTLHTFAPPCAGP